MILIQSFNILLARKIINDFLLKYQNVSGEG